MAPFDKEKLSIMDLLKIVGIIAAAVTFGATFGVYSQRITSVEARTSVLEGKVTQIDQINERLATIDANLSFLKDKLTGVQIIRN